MSDKTKIEWSDATWNPVTGCTKVSEGCRNCYALTFAERFRGTPGHYFENGFDITLRSDKLSQPYRWKKPRKIFVNSMSDLFHKDIPDDYIWNVFEIMARSPQHIFQVLTKRPQRMVDLLAGRYWRDLGTSERPFFAKIIKGEHLNGDVPFLPNVWLGVSVENQQAADERIPLLLQTPAAVRFLSCEPLLGPVDLWSPKYDWPDGGQGKGSAFAWGEGISWVIVGGESSHNARPMHPEWARSLRDQCMAAGVPFFFKQWGEWYPLFDQPWETKPKGKGETRIINIEGGQGYHGEGAIWTKRIGKKVAGRLLDGRTWDEFPDEQR